MGPAVRFGALRRKPLEGRLWSLPRWAPGLRLVIRDLSLAQRPEPRKQNRSPDPQAFNRKPQPEPADDTSALSHETKPYPKAVAAPQLGWSHLLKRVGGPPSALRAWQTTTTDSSSSNNNNNIKTSTATICILPSSSSSSLSPPALRTSPSPSLCSSSPQSPSRSTGPHSPGNLSSPPLPSVAH